MRMLASGSMATRSREQRVLAVDVLYETSYSTSNFSVELLAQRKDKKGGGGGELPCPTSATDIVVGHHNLISPSINIFSII